MPEAADGLEQRPFAGSQVPCVWHWVGAGQVTVSVPAQTPFWQVPVVMQPLPPHVVPSGALGLVQPPMAATQVPATWHSSSGRQTTGNPWQTPFVQTSPVVQSLPSSHALPSSTATQVPIALAATQVWHWSVQPLSQQTPWAQNPLWHWSAIVQVAPLPSRGTHRPPMQALPLAQSAAAVTQEVRHAVAPQT